MGKNNEVLTDMKHEQFNLGKWETKVSIFNMHEILILTDGVWLISSDSILNHL